MSVNDDGYPKTPGLPQAAARVMSALERGEKLAAAVRFKKQRPSMSLVQALTILVDVHTKPDAELGFIVQMGATPYPGASPAMSSDYDYTEAWGVLRRALGEPT